MVYESSLKFRRIFGKSALISGESPSLLFNNVSAGKYPQPISDNREFDPFHRPFFFDLRNSSEKEWILNEYSEKIVLEITGRKTGGKVHGRGSYERRVVLRVQQSVVDCRNKPKKEAKKSADFFQE